MFDKKDLIKETQKEFERLQKEFGFKTTFDELENEFYIKDHVLETGFIQENFEMELTSRIVDYFRNWASYLNSLLMPNPSYYANQTESKLFNSEEDKKKIWKIIKVCMKFSSMYSLMFLKKDKEMIAKFIDESYQAWISEVRPFMSATLGRAYEGWNK